MNRYAKVGGEGGWKIWKTISYSHPSKETEVQCMTSSNEKNIMYAWCIQKKFLQIIDSPSLRVANLSHLYTSYAGFIQ